MAVAARSEEVYSRSVRRVLLITLALNLSVLAGKLAAGLIAGSLSVLSDAFHSSADCLNNMIGLFIIRLAGSGPDKEHPYGHTKFETLAAFVIASFLLVTAFEVAVGAAQRLLGWKKANVDVSFFTIGVMGATLVINGATWVYERGRAKKLGSSFLLADSQHTFSDVFISATILLGLVLLHLGIVDLDAVLALGVAGVITYAAYQIFSSTVPILVDRAPLPPEFIAEIVRATPGVESVHEIMSRGVPGKIFITMHLVVTPHGTVEAHAITEEVERRLEDRVGHCQVTIHIEPDASY
jgi:cation diffusion facilitator family transporter